MGAVLGAEGGAAEEEAEGAEGMGAVAGLEGGLEVDFVVAAGAGEGAAVVEAPDAAVSEDAPADAAVGVDVGGGEVAEDLGVGVSRSVFLRGRRGAGRSACFRRRRGRRGSGRRQVWWRRCLWRWRRRRAGGRVCPGCGRCLAGAGSGSSRAA